MTLTWPAILLRLHRARQDTGAAVCLPRKPYYLEREQTVQQRHEVETLLCQEFGYVKTLGPTARNQVAMWN
jgi:hypothetical protein